MKKLTLFFISVFFITSLNVNVAIAQENNYYSERAKEIAQRVRPYAFLSDVVYDDKVSKFEQWEKVDSSSDEKTGFYAATYKNKDTGEVVVAFRGTEPTSRKDWNADFDNINSSSNVLQYEEAVKYVEKIKADESIDFDKVVFTGHSLGGGLAQTVGMIHGNHTVTFNSATPNLYQVAYNLDASTKKIIEDLEGSEYRDALGEIEDFANNNIFDIIGNIIALKNVIISPAKKLIIDLALADVVLGIIERNYEYTGRITNVTTKGDHIVSGGGFLFTKAISYIRNGKIILPGYTKFIFESDSLWNADGEHTIKHILENLYDKDQSYYVEGVTTTQLPPEFQLPMNQNEMYMGRMIAGITNGGSSRIGSAAYFVGSSEADVLEEVEERENADLLGARESAEYTDGSVLTVPVDVILDWGDSPSDLDSHLTGPVAGGGNARFHIYFSAKGSFQNEDVGAFLHRDDRSHQAGGANLSEQTRIFSLNNGVYRFYVHDFTNGSATNSTALSESGAVVTFHDAGQSSADEGVGVGQEVARINVPTNREGTVWKAFELDSRTGVLNESEEFRYEDSIDSVPFDE